MECNWASFLRVLPPRLRQGMANFEKQGLRELRLRLGSGAELVLEDRFWTLPGMVTREELQYVLNAASDYSPWAASSSAQGYLTIEGGHRIGLCGQVIRKQGCVAGFSVLSSLCIRLARDLSVQKEKDFSQYGSILILGAPGWGKTTLLRCVARNIAESRMVAVVDERGELFPSGFRQGKHMDVLSGCPKAAGIEMVLRSMGPDYIALDEITAQADTQTLIQAAGCGVGLLATAHAADPEDLLRRPCYRPLAESRVFQTLLMLDRKKTYRRERMEKWITNGLAQSW